MAGDRQVLVQRQPPPLELQDISQTSQSSQSLPNTPPPSIPVTTSASKTVTTASSTPAPDSQNQPPQQMLSLLPMLSQLPVRLPSMTAGANQDSSRALTMMPLFSPHMFSVHGMQQVVPTASHEQSPKDSSQRPDRCRKRRRTTPSELEVLESEFRRNNKPSKDMRERIAERLGMEEKAVQIWFQNKRQSCRRRPPTSSSEPAAKNSGSPHAGRSMSVPQSAFMRMDLPPRPPSAPIPIFHDENTSQESKSTTSNAPTAEPDKKGVRLTMSADGKAQIVMRSPLKPIRNSVIAQRFTSAPILGRSRGEADTECARNLLFLRSGSRW